MLSKKYLFLMLFIGSLVEAVEESPRASEAVAAAELNLRVEVAQTTLEAAVETFRVLIKDINLGNDDTEFSCVDGVMRGKVAVFPKGGTSAYYNGRFELNFLDTSLPKLLEFNCGVVLLDPINNLDQEPEDVVTCINKAVKKAIIANLSSIAEVMGDSSIPDTFGEILKALEELEGACKRASNLFENAGRRAF